MHLITTKRTLKALHRAVEECPEQDMIFMCPDDESPFAFRRILLDLTSRVSPKHYTTLYLDIASQYLYAITQCAIIFYDNHCEIEVDHDTSMDMKHCLAVWNQFHNLAFAVNESHIY